MRILYLHQYFKTPSEPGTTRSYHFARYLVERGNTVIMITSQCKGTSRRFTYTENVDGISVIYIRNKYSNKMGKYTRIFSFIKFMIYASIVSFFQKDIDVVFATSTPLSIGVPALIMRWYYRVPMIFELRDLWPQYAIEYGVLKNRLLIKLAQLLEFVIYRYSSHIITTTPSIKDLLVSRNDINSKIDVIPIGSNLELYGSIENGSAVCEVLKNDKFIVMYVGTVSTVNAIDKVIEAFRHIRNYQIELWIIGDGKCKQSLFKKVNSLGLANVKFFDPVAQDLIPKYLYISDLCVISAQNRKVAEAIFPNKLFDYLAAGKPVIVNFYGVCMKLILDNECGCFVKPDDALAFAKKIIELKENPDQMKRMGINARNVAERLLNRRKLAKDFLVVFEKVYNDAKTM